MFQTNAKVVIERLKLVVGVTTDAELCESIGLTRQKLSNWKARDSVPYTLCVQIAMDRNASLDWLLLGRGSRLINESTIAEPFHPYLTTPTDEEKELLATLKKLPPDVKSELMENAKLKGKVSEMDERLEKLQIQIQAMLKSKQNDGTKE